MGQKVNPIGLRLGINRTWDSRWFAGKAEYGTLLHEDIKIRKELMKQLKQAAVYHIVIERPHRNAVLRFTRHARASSSARRAPTSRSCAGGRQAHRQRRRDQHRRNPQAGARSQLVAESFRSSSSAALRSAAP